MSTAFVNVYFDWHNSSSFTPFVGGGLGAAFLEGRATAGTRVLFTIVDTNGFYTFEPVIGYEFDTTDFKTKKTQFAWHIDLGLSYDMTEKVTIDLSYRYLDIGAPLKAGEPKFRTVRDSGQYYNLDATFNPPSEIVFEATHQAVLGVRYSF
jgi:opacity protein-like surface antigen